MIDITRLLKPFILVWDDSLNIECELHNNAETNPREGANFAEFDTLEELEKFITDNKLKTDPEKITS